jgi:pimeloyl-ACP methyl ester carboxylesterase
VFKWFKQKLDHWAITAACSTLPSPDPDPNQAAELNRILENPDFFTPPERVADVTFSNEREFEFNSSVELYIAENNRVHGWFLRQGADWQKHPLVILLHGWNAEMYYQYVLPKLGRRLVRLGVNALAFELPLHSQRRPKPPHRVQNFISDDLPVMLGACKQSLADVHSLLLWAKAQGCPKVGCWGFSLGGWLAGMYATVKPSADAVVLSTAVTSLSDAIRDLAFCHPIRATLQVVPMDTRQLDLENRRPQVAPEKILLQEGAYDSFISRESYERLARAWHLSNWLICRESHISILTSKRAMKQGARWVADKLSQGAAAGT